MSMRKTTKAGVLSRCTLQRRPMLLKLLRQPRCTWRQFCDGRKVLPTGGRLMSTKNNKGFNAAALLRRFGFCDSRGDVNGGRK